MSTIKSKPQPSGPKTKKSSFANWRETQRRNRERHSVANLITVVMIAATILMLVWIAYQLNNPIAIDLSRLIHR